MDDASFLQSLKDNHHFPEMMTFKVIGPNTPEYVAAVLHEVESTLRLKFEPRHTCKVTPNQKYVSVTIEAIAGTAEDLAATFSGLAKVPGTIMVL